jgi:uncharacterized protein (TIGR03083 family)
MFDLTTATKAADRDFGAIIDRLDQLTEPDWERPVRCDGWTVRSLARHLIAASRGQAEGLRRSAAGQHALAALDPPRERATGEVLTALRAGREELLLALGALPDAALAGLAPLPFGLLPVPVALQIVPLEYGFHRNDLDWALGEHGPLSEDIASSLLGLAPGLMPILAAGTPVGPPGVAPDAPTAYLLAAASATVGAAFDGTAWTVAPEALDAPDTCQIRGDDSPVALFIMGRIGTDHPDLTVSDLAVARRFKRYFPGP